MKNLIILSSIVLISGLISCESLVTNLPPDKLPKGTEKIVLHSYISPQDTIILVKVTASKPIFGTFTNNGYGYTVVGKDTIFYTGDSIGDAKVRLSNTKQQFIELSYDKREGVYLVDTKKFPIVAGETYTLTAEAKQGKAEATCTVPMDVVTIKKYSIDTSTNNNQFFTRKETKVKFTWDDIKGETNYYSIKARVKAEVLVPELKANKEVEYIRRTSVYTAYWMEDNGVEEYQNDLNVDGASFSSPTGVIPMNMGVFNISGKNYYAKLVEGKSLVTMELLNVDKNYYNYHRSVRKNADQGDNPFAEPVPIFSNVKGGLGCFAASNKSILKVEF